MSRSLHHRLALLSATLLLLGAAQSVWAAPNTDDPFEPLQTRTEEEVQALAAEAAKEYRTAADLVTSMVEKLKSNELKKISPKDFATAWVAKLRMDRLGKQLELWGETAGVDFQKRADAINSDWQMVKKEFVKLPEISSKLPTALKAFSSDAAKRKNNLTAAGKLYQQKEYEKAEAALLKDIEALEASGCLLEDTQRDALSPFNVALGRVMADLNKIRAEAGKQRLQALVDAEPPEFDALLAQLKQAATDLKAGQDPTFDGQQMTGPELVKAVGTTWRKAQLAALHVQGYYASMGMKWGGSNSEPLSKAVSAQEKFSTDVLQELGAVIAADAARTSAEQAEEVYLAYLAELGPLATLAVPGTVQKALQPQLDSLVARSAALQADVSAYRVATDELLRWRRLVADGQQKKASQDFPEVAATVAQIVRVPQGSSVGLLNQTASTTQKLALIAPLTLVLERMKTELIGKPVQIGSCVGIVPAKQLVATHYRDRHYATFTLPSGFDVERQALKADLLVSDALPPLTLTAAMAVAAADRGDLQAAGVEINKIFVEPLATRMATLPAAASPMMPLGPLPLEAMDETPLHQILLRTDVTPQWVRNEYFFISAK